MNLSNLENVVVDGWPVFSGNSFRSTDILWADEPLSSKDSALKKLLNRPYGIKDSTCFKGLQFDQSDAVKLVVERYGGEGVSANGGGGRCGNVGRYQIKGIGANCMVGDHGEKVHSYGGLDAPLATVETIFTNFFSQIMPLGAVPVRGLVMVGEDTAFYHHPANTCWGVVMIRDNCLRPAHLMRAPQFKPRDAYRHKLYDDLARVRRLNKRLASVYPDPNEFIMLLGQFLKNCANQFGFARAMRIMHGAMTPSNLAINGQWLDLPMASAVRGGVNQCLTSQFFSEHECPVSCVVEILYNFGKYNGKFMNPDPLINYYYERFDAYFRLYVGYLVGLNSDVIDKLDVATWTTVSDAFRKVIHANPKVVNDPVTFTSDDPVHCLIKGLFLSFKDSGLAKTNLKKSGFSDSETALVIDAFVQCLQASWYENKSNYRSQEEFNACLALVALKRAYLACIFYTHSVSDRVWKLCQEGVPEDIGDLIYEYQSIGRWAFEDQAPRMTVLECSGLSVYREYGLYTYTYQNKNSMYTNDLGEIIQVFTSLKVNDDKHKYEVITVYLSVLNEVLPTITNQINRGSR